jgi:hypothetical protein
MNSLVVDHVAAAVSGPVEPSVYVPVAVNCWVSPFAMLAVVGLTAMDASTGSDTVSIADPLTLVAGSVAVTVTVPTT